jgi:hypothetical protein
MMEWIGNNVIPIISMIGALIATLIWASYWIGSKIGTFNQNLNSINNQVIPAIVARIIRLETYFDTTINNRIKQRNSPVTLTPYAEQILKDIEFSKTFNLIKDELCKRLDEYRLRTKYDVQEMSDFLMKKLRDDNIFIPLKQAAFAKGYNLDEILSAASIPLRDYYLSIHPEIKD